MRPQPSTPCWCGSTLASTRFRTPTFGLLCCSACGTFRIDPPPIARDDQSGDFYTAYYAARNLTAPDGGPPRRGRVSRFWKVVQQVPALRKTADTVMDFGSGDGRLCYELSEAGWKDVVGVDVSRARVARARQQYPGIRFYDRPVQETDVATRSADLCVMDNVIEHLTEPSELIGQLQHYVKPGGRIVVITPNMESGQFRLLGRRWTPELAPHAHIFLFTPASLSQLLTRAGFVVREVGDFHDDPYPFSVWARRLLSGDIKGSIWRAHQELGALYGRLINRGSMVFVVADVPVANTSATSESGRQPDAVISTGTHGATGDFR